jgi:hypothetical protein
MTSLALLVSLPGWLCSIVAAYLIATMAYSAHPLAVTVYLLLLFVSILCQLVLFVGGE